MLGIDLVIGTKVSTCTFPNDIDTVGHDSRVDEVQPYIKNNKCKHLVECCYVLQI